MKDQDLKLAHIIDEDALHAKLAAIAKHYGDSSLPDARRDILSALKQVHASGKSRAEAMLFDDGKGLDCAKRLAHLQDVIIRVLLNFALEHRFASGARSSGERLCVAAVGGYGRRTMAPGSDVDLLFIFPYKQTPLVEQVTEYILYMLWDMGLKVGHATRSVEDSIRLSKADMTICTSILEARHVAGDQALFDELERAFGDEVIARISSQFIHEKLAERDARHKRMGESRYVVEPNVKEGKGGLRDLHTLFWIAKFFYQVRKRADLLNLGVFSRTDYRQFIKCEDFLWAVRCHLHFMTGKAEERLSFEVQKELAARLGYQSHPGMQNVERFMKHYFLIAKQVGDLTRVFCADLEERDVKQVPPLNRLFQKLTMRNRQEPIEGEPGFVIDNKRINITGPDVFDNDPVAMVRMFEIADRLGLEYHPDALQAIRPRLKLFKKPLRDDPAANRHFLNVLTSRNDPELNLRRMNEAGVLGRFIRDFGRIVAMMQFNMYHSYTVDEHLIRTVGVLAALEDGVISEDHPLASKLLPTLSDDRELLYVTLFLHDVAKGRPEDHSTAGAAVARRLCPRLGLSDEDTEMVAWLIENHLIMSTVAQTRDLNDRKTIEDFTKTVQTLRRLKLLLILTVCDIRAVGPNVWNGWKGQLLRTLYAEAELTLTGGFSEADRKGRAAHARAQLVEALDGWSAEDAEHYSELHYDNYLLTVDRESQRRHTEMLRALDRDDRKLQVDVRTNDFHDITEITVITPDHPRLLAIIAAACSSAGALIDNAQAFTTKDGRAIDIILINREFDYDEDEFRRGRRVAKLIEEVLTGKSQLPDMIEARSAAKRPSKAFKVDTKVNVNDTLSRRFSVIEFEALDRPGLLAEIANALSDLRLDIHSAHITTFGEKAVDAFYVTDLLGLKLSSPDRIAAIVKTLTQVGDELPVTAIPATAPRKTRKPRKRVSA